MHLGTRKQSATAILTLQNASVCVECESVTDDRLKECPVCGSPTLLNFGRMIGGTLPLHKINRATEKNHAERFDLEFTIDLKEMELKDLNAAIQYITGLLGPRLVRGRAHCHISVEPVAAGGDAGADAA